MLAEVLDLDPAEPGLRELLAELFLAETRARSRGRTGRSV
jgi:hypothetical protein